MRRQCELLAVGRSGLYYEPETTSTDELALMRRIDELHLKHPFYGSCNIAHTLSIEGTAVNRKCVQRLFAKATSFAIRPPWRWFLRVRLR